MTKKTKYEFPADVGPVTKWAIDSWQEEVAREMIIAGMEWLEQERREYIGWRFWRQWTDNQYLRLMKNPASTEKKSKSLDIVLLAVLEHRRRKDYTDANGIFILVVNIIFWVCQKSWPEFIQGLQEITKSQNAKMN